MTARAAAVLGVVVVAVAACTTTIFHAVDRGRPLQPRPVADVAVLACAPSRPFRVLGRFEAQASSVMPILRQVEPLDARIVDGFRHDAAGIGCDAIVASEEACSEGCPRAPNNKALQRCADDPIEGYGMTCIAFVVTDDPRSNPPPDVR